MPLFFTTASSAVRDIVSTAYTLRDSYAVGHRCENVVPHVAIVKSSTTQPT